MLTYGHWCCHCTLLSLEASVNLNSRCITQVFFFFFTWSFTCRPELFHQWICVLHGHWDGFLELARAAGTTRLSAEHALNAAWTKCCCSRPHMTELWRANPGVNLQGQKSLGPQCCKICWRNGSHGRASVGSVSRCNEVVSDSTFTVISNRIDSSSGSITSWVLQLL